MKEIPWVWHDHRADLPQWLTAGIGQIAVEWALLERELEETIRLACDVDIRNGRMLTTGMNARGRIRVITSFLQDHVYRDRISARFLANFIKLGETVTEKLEAERNLMVHGLWDRTKGQWYVLQNSGSRSVPQLQPDIKKLARAVLPQRKLVSRKSLAETTAKIAAASHALVGFCEDLQPALAPLQHKSPQYTRRRRRPRARSGKVP